MDSLSSKSLQECATLEGSKNGLQSRLSEQELATSQLKQDLVRVTLAKQTLEYEKKELLRRVDELERGLAGVKNENGEKDKLIRAHKQQIEEFARKQRDFNLAASAAGVRLHFTLFRLSPMTSHEFQIGFVII